MGFFERNRASLAERGIDPARLPPGQYSTERFPVLHVGDVPTYAPDRSDWSLTVGGLVGDAAHVLVGGAARAAGHRDRHRHPLRHQVVEVRHHVEGRAVPRPARRVRRRARRRRPTCVETAEHGYTTNVPLADLHGRRRAGRVRVRPRADRARARWAGAARGAAPLLLEVGQVAPRRSSCSTTTSSASGSATATTPTATRSASSATADARSGAIGRSGRAPSAGRGRAGSPRARPGCGR